MRRATLLKALAIVGLSTTMQGCDVLQYLFWPCSPPSNTINGTWRLSTINGSPIPAGGYRDPSRPDVLQSATLYLVVTNQTSCSDTAPQERGTAVIEYTLLTTSGTPKAAEQYSGSFETTDDSPTNVYLEANGGSLGGSRESNRITFSGTLPGYGGRTLVFTRN